jgi:DNA-binding response OmpR family regulator
MNNKVILCIEDNIQVQAFNKPLLESKGFIVKQVTTLSEAREIVRREMPDLIILDIHLPDGNGLEFLRELRKSQNVPVIALTKDKEEADLVAGLDSGCDDYVTKPHTFPVLYARIEAVMRRAENVPGEITKWPLRLDILAGQAFSGAENLLLTKKDFALLLLFMQSEEKAMSADYLYEKVWKAPMNADSQAIRSAIARLRKRLGGSGYTIVTQRGEGYIFELE